MTGGLQSGCPGCTVAHQRVTIAISVEKASYVTVPDENNVSQPVVPGLWCPTDGHEAVHVFGFWVQVRGRSGT